MQRIAILSTVGVRSRDRNVGGWWTLCIVPLMSKRTECIVDNGEGCAELSVFELV